MVATRISFQELNRATALLGRVLLCLALLLNFSVVAVEDLQWSAADKVLDECRVSLVPMVAKTCDHSNPTYANKAKLAPESWCQLYSGHQFLLQGSLTLSVQHHRAPPKFNSLVCNAPFPPRSPTA